MLVAVHADPAGVADVVGPGAYSRGLRYAQQDAVAEMAWDSSGALHGLVHGSRDQIYETIAHFSPVDGATLVFQGGECSCPVGVDCKHVVALALTAMQPDHPGAAQDERSPSMPWERSLGSLLEPGSSGQDSGAPLAIELSLSAGAQPTRLGSAPAGPALRLNARLVTRGKTGWVGGDLAWSRLSSLWHWRGYSASHLRLLQEMYALYQAHRDRHAYYYGEEKHIDLTGFESRQLWPMLDEAAAIGLRLVHARKRFGDVAPRVDADLCLDVTSADSAGPLVVRPVIRLDSGDAGVDPAPVGFIGAEGHGLVYVDRADAQRGSDTRDWRPRLAKLARAVPPPLQRMALEQQRLDIPVAERGRFRDEYYLRLRRLAPVVSSDRSFTPPAVSGPTLVLRVCHGVGHHVDLDWEWEYEVGDTVLRAPLRPGPAEPGYRDPDAERATLTGLPLQESRLLDAGADTTLPADPRLVLAPHAELDGLDTMRFTTEVLPLLADAPGVRVEVSGTAAAYREVSDSLTIGVATADVAGETDWFDLGVEITVEGRQVPFADVFVALANGESHLMLADGAYFSLDKPALRRLASLIEEARALTDSPPGGSLKISRFQAGLWEELAGLGVVSRQAEAWRQQVGGLLSAGSIEPAPPPEVLAAELRPYQRDGYGWLAFLWRHRLGGILADDMGLGKTLQSLALICHAKQSDPGARFLVVAPTSVVSNWAAEAARFAPHLRVVAITDTMRRRGQTLEEITTDADVAITSYTLFRLEFDAYSELPWSGLILDEAQFVKNHQSKAYQCARRLPAPFKLAITGTPMENNLMELWSLLSITAPGLFPSPARFRDYYARPIEKQGDTELLGQLRRRIKPLLRRRTKELVVADLPAKQEQVLEVELHPRHRKLYQTHLQRERQKILGLIDDLNANRFTILRSLTLLRQLSLHAGLIDAAHQEVASAKIEVLVDQLRDVIGGGHRALVFSQFTGFLDTVRARLNAEGIQHCYLDGKTRDRATVLDRFKTGGAPVFLISLKAGGFGLNLTEADYCFLLDPWWNPATEAQAVDRTHRIGQTRNVMVYRLIAKDTIEEKVMALKARKSELFASVLDDGEAFSATLDADDIRGLLT